MSSSPSSSSSSDLSNYSQWQKIYYGAAFISSYFFVALISVFQAPIFPGEAESKGLKPSEYGIVFGIFYLTMFVVCILLGKYMPLMGTKVTLNIGVAMVGIASIGFGLLEYIDQKYIFLGLAIFLRIVEATGSSFNFTALYCLIVDTFSENMAKAFSLAEACFGVGSLIGPPIAGGLFELGGFVLPFTLVGGILMFLALILAFILPNMPKSKKPPQKEDKPSTMKAIKVPAVLVALYSVGCCGNLIGFLQSTLVLHLNGLGLSTVGKSAFFIIIGSCYGLTCPLFGILCDRYSAKFTIFLGAICSIAGFAIMDPLPVFHLEKSIPLIVVGLIIAGIGYSAENTAGFIYAHRESVKNGLPDTVGTYGLISGLWVACYAMGNFLGPTLGGILYDEVGYVKASYYVIITQVLLILFLCILCCFHHSLCHQSQGYDAIEHEEKKETLKRTMLPMTPR